MIPRGSEARAAPGFSSTLHCFVGSCEDLQRFMILLRFMCVFSFAHGL